MHRTKIALLAGLFIAAIVSGYAMGAAFFPRTSPTEPVGSAVRAQVPVPGRVPIRAAGPPRPDVPPITLSVPLAPTHDGPQPAPMLAGSHPSSATPPLSAASGVLPPSMANPGAGVRADRLPSPTHGPAARTPQPQRPSSLGPVLPKRRVVGSSALAGGRSGVPTVRSNGTHPAGHVSANPGGDIAIVRPSNTAPETASRGTMPPQSTSSVPSVPALVAISGSAAERFHVQVGSFDVRQDADALAQRLEQHWYSTSVTKDAPYRVWVGGYLDRPTANRLVSALQQIGVTATIVP